MPARALQRLRPLGATWAGAGLLRWAASAVLLVVVAIASYLRLGATAATAADVSAVSFAAASESPVCDGPREAASATDDVGSATLLRAARPVSQDGADTPSRLRDDGAGCVVAGGGVHAAALGHLREIAARPVAAVRTRAESPSRKRARLMVFLN